MTLSPTADTHLRSGAPNSNRGSDTFLRINSPRTVTRTATDTPLGGVPIATPTETFTATPTPGGATCGNRVLEPGETCASCPADCVVGPCTRPGAPTAAFRVDLVPPLGFAPTTATVLLGYDSTKLSIPGTGTELSVRQRVVAPAPAPPLADLDCTVLSCAQGGTRVPGCTCTVSLP